MLWKQCQGCFLRALCRDLPARPGLMVETIILLMEEGATSVAAKTSGEVGTGRAALGDRRHLRDSLTGRGQREQRGRGGSARQPRWRRRLRRPLCLRQPPHRREGRETGAARTRPHQGGRGGSGRRPISCLHFLSSHRGSPGRRSPRSRPIRAALGAPPPRGWRGRGGGKCGVFVFAPSSPRPRGAHEY